MKTYDFSSQDQWHGDEIFIISPEPLKIGEVVHLQEIEEGELIVELNAEVTGYRPSRISDSFVIYLKVVKELV